jgi:hypothetical protein
MQILVPHEEQDLATAATVRCRALSANVTYRLSLDGTRMRDLSVCQLQTELNATTAGQSTAAAAAIVPPPQRRGKRGTPMVRSQSIKHKDHKTIKKDPSNRFSPQRRIPSLYL